MDRSQPPPGPPSRNQLEIWSQLIEIKRDLPVLLEAPQESMDNTHLDSTVDVQGEEVEVLSDQA